MTTHAVDDARPATRRDERTNANTNAHMTTLASLVDERCARAYEETYESIDAAAAVPRAHLVCDDDDDDELFIVRVSRDVRAGDLRDVAFDVAREEGEDAGEVATTGETRVGTFSTTTRARAYDVRGDGGGVLARRGRAISGVLTVTRALATGEERDGEETTTRTTRGAEDAEDAEDDARAKKKEKKRDKEKKKDKKKERARGDDDDAADASRKRSRS